MVGGVWELGGDPAGSADHGLRLQAVGFEADALEEFDQDIQCCLEEHWIPQCKVGVIHIKDCEEPSHQLSEFLYPMVLHSLLLHTPKCCWEGCPDLIASARAK